MANLVIHVFWRVHIPENLGTKYFPESLAKGMQGILNGAFRQAERGGGLGV